MEHTAFTNDVILSWLDYFSRNVEMNLAEIKILDITGKNKNIIPTVMSHRAVVVLTDAGHPDVFYDMWNAELGECTIWYNEGSEPVGAIKETKVSNMIDRGINAPAAMLIMNPDAATNYHIGMENSRFSCGSVHYACQEVRAVIMNKLNLADRDTICIISGESIAVEAAIVAGEGHVFAVEYDSRDRVTMQENIEKFGLKNVTVVSSLDDGFPANLPVPDSAFIVASPRIDHEIEKLLAVNPEMKILIYSLDFEILLALPSLFEKFGLEKTEVIHVGVSRLNSKNMMEPFPAPWLIAGKRGQTGGEERNLRIIS